MKIIKYFFEFIFIYVLLIIFKIIGYKNASNFGAIIGKKIGPLFRSNSKIQSNLENSNIGNSQENRKSLRRKKNDGGTNAANGGLFEILFPREIRCWLCQPRSDLYSGITSSRVYPAWTNTRLSLPSRRYARAAKHPVFGAKTPRASSGHRPTALSRYPHNSR